MSLDPTAHDTRVLTELGELLALLAAHGAHWAGLSIFRRSEIVLDLADAGALPAYLDQQHIHCLRVGTGHGDRWHALVRGALITWPADPAASTSTSTH